MQKKLTVIKGKNGEVRNGLLQWINVPEGAIGEFWFYDGISPMGMWGRLDYWEVIGNGIKIHKVRVMVS
jgi:hypothetical protein